MTFVLYSNIDFNYVETKTFATLEELAEFGKMSDGLIIDFNYMTITVCNEYLD